MIAQLLFALILIQPAQPTEAPVTEPAAATQSATPAAESGAPAEAAAAEPEEKRICRRRMIRAEGVGQRFRSEEVCKTRDEWAEDSRRRR